MICLNKKCITGHTINRNIGLSDKRFLSNTTATVIGQTLCATGR